MAGVGVGHGAAVVRMYCNSCWETLPGESERMRDALDRTDARDEGERRRVATLQSLGAGRWNPAAAL